MTSPPGRAARRTPALVAAAALAAGLVAGCSSDPQQAYCATVEKHQAELGAIIGSGERDALLQARPIYEDLAEDAPRDIAGEWRTVLRSIDSVEAAFDEAGVDPSSYDPENPPPGLDDEERADLERAAAGLLDPRTRKALAEVEQHALDVCKTPLSL
ncbi:hypothetical protein [Nocardioides sp.]|uniref:hypothetical protein n=1 Tax=Nocardioides sp. TaxID=35761 RepID=UPI002736D472|nr:hypothetical protein [Nocardioides sp.]MDP3889724.1 hypothetical protein [Nocardioides sp.]